MIKLNLMTLLAAAALAGSTAFAGDKACCATTASNDMKHSCSASFANLDLNAEQKAKMEKLAAECDKGGCNKATMAKMEKGAKGILSEQQFAAWKAACTGMKSGHTRS